MRIQTKLRKFPRIFGIEKFQLHQNKIFFRPHHRSAKEEEADFLQSLSGATSPAISPADRMTRTEQIKSVSSIHKNDYGGQFEKKQFFFSVGLLFFVALLKLIKNVQNFLTEKKKFLNIHFSFFFLIVTFIFFLGKTVQDDSINFPWKHFFFTLTHFFFQRSY